jgi:hypothetical protein
MLYEFITTHKAEILSRARAKVTTRPWPAVSTHELETGLPLFLTQLAETLRLKFTSEPMETSARPSPRRRSKRRSRSAPRSSRP